MEFMRTGVPGVDQLLEDKGIPSGYMVFVLGGPGSGKTTFALQYLCKGIGEHGQKGVYVSLDEDLSVIKRNALAFGWDLDNFQKEGMLALLDASPLRKLPGEVKIGGISIGRRDFTLVSLINAIEREVKQIGASRLVIDPMATLVVQFPGEAERRTAVMDLMEGIVKSGCTALLVSELAQSSLERAYQFEEYLAQGVLMLRKILRPGGLIRVFQVEKMRGIDHDTQPHPYKITKKGIEVYPSEIAL